MILSRTFHRGEPGDNFEAEVGRLRATEAELARRTGFRSEPRWLKRVRRTPALKGMSLSQRKRIVAGALSAKYSAAN